MRGLSSEEVKQRQDAGLVNDARVKTSRTYSDIIIKNVFTPLNIILFVLGITLFILDRPVSAISATGIITVNILISTIQEMRAKRRLDKITLLTRPKVTAIRDGNEVQIDQSEIVKDDVLVIRAGEQALVDGKILECRSLEMDESLLTGESTTVRKNPESSILSGSVCITGEGYYTVTAFGGDSYASQMLSSAKKFTSKKTPLQMETNTITTVLTIIAFVFLFLTVIVELIRGFSLDSMSSIGFILETFVVCLDIIPIALFLLITLTYMLAAIRMSETGVLLQRFNSVESMSHVDTVCMDKTGTITTNNLLFESAEYLVPQEEAEMMIKLFATNTGSPNKTIRALADNYGTLEAELIDEIQFSSSRKYSAVKVRYQDKTYTLYSGAWNVIKPHCSDAEKVDEVIHRESDKGFRTLVLCSSDDLPFTSGDDFVINPLKPLCIISIRDQVRPDCRETIDVFLQNGMDLKVISGDDPNTIEALFKIADIPGERKIISGPDLDNIPDSEMDDVVLNTNIFGRMKPENKEKVIEVLKRNKRYVAMIGDGVNDVKSIKSAQVGIALHSGSGAARGVADMILMDDNFAALPKALVEGRRTTSGIRDILKVYLSRNFSLAVMYLVIFFFVGTIPMIPAQNLFYVFVSVTVIAFFLTIFAMPDKNDELILPDVLQFVIPSAVIIGTLGIITYLVAGWLTMNGYIIMDYSYFEGFYSILGYDSVDDAVRYSLFWSDFYGDVNGLPAKAEVVSRSCMVLFCAVTGCLQLLIVCPYFKFLSTNGKVNKRKLPIILVVFILSLVVLMYAFFPFVAALVGMAIPSALGFVLPLGMTALAFILILLSVKMNLMKNLVELFENWYIKKLQKEYTKGDVVNVDSNDKLF